MVLIGSEAWVRDTKGWSAVEPDSIRPLAMANVRAILKVGTYIERLKDDGTGPITAGEPTRRYRDTSNMAAENEAQAIDEEIARTSPECIKELERLKKDFTDLQAELEQVELVVGETTNRLYLLTIDRTRHGTSDKTELTVDEYEASVEIRPPASSLPLKPSSDSKSCIS